MTDTNEPVIETGSTALAIDLQALQQKVTQLETEKADLQARFDKLFNQAVQITKERDEWKKLTHGQLQMAEFMRSQAEQVIKEINSVAQKSLFQKEQTPGPDDLLQATSKEKIDASGG